MCLTFDIQIPTPKGLLFGMYLERETAQIAARKPRIMTVQRAHEVFGHCDEEKTRRTAKLLGIELARGKLGPCEACATAKAKQKNVPKENPDGSIAAKPGEARIYLDISSIRHYENDKTKPRVSKPHWRIMVDSRTQMKFSDFYKTIRRRTRWWSQHVKSYTSGKKMDTM